MDLSMVENKIKEFRGQRILLDCDVASLYEVETKRINEAVKNNPEKFPEGYVFSLTSEEVDSLMSKFSTLKNKGRGQHTKYRPKAFTEKGLYMLATILKSPVATKDLSRTISELSVTESEQEINALAQKGTRLFSDILENNLNVSDTETTIEVNFAMLRFKHTIKRKKEK